MKEGVSYMMCCPRVILMAFGLILLVSIQAGTNSLGNTETRHYCGETLKNMLMFHCNSVYKRSTSTEIDMMNWMPGDSPSVYGQRSYFPFKPRANAVSLIPRQYKRQRGVVDECCRKPCTIAELSTYCGVKTR